MMHELRLRRQSTRAAAALGREESLSQKCRAVPTAYFGKLNTHECCECIPGLTRGLDLYSSDGMKFIDQLLKSCSHSVRFVNDLNSVEISSNGIEI